MTNDEWTALKRQIEERVELRETEVRLGGRDFVWHRVSDPDTLLQSALEAEGQAGEEAHDPFWAATWRAARGLDRFLGTLAIEGVRILELGCGSGQAGTGAAARGAIVTLTDCVPLALQVAQLNSWPVRGRIDFQTLLWGESRLAAPAFPIIIGSDLVYDPGLFERLDVCAQQHLTEDGVLLLSEPHRHTGDKFATWIRDAGWCTQEHDVDLHDERVPIRIFECRRR